MFVAHYSAAERERRLQAYGNLGRTHRTYTNQVVLTVAEAVAVVARSLGTVA